MLSELSSLLLFSADISERRPTGSKVQLGKFTGRLWWTDRPHILLRKWLIRFVVMGSSYLRGLSGWKGWVPACWRPSRQYKSAAPRWNTFTVSLVRWLFVSLTAPMFPFTKLQFYFCFCLILLLSWTIMFGAALTFSHLSVLIWIHSHWNFSSHHVLAAFQALPGEHGLARVSHASSSEILVSHICRLLVSALLFTSTLNISFHFKAWRSSAIVYLLYQLKNGFYCITDERPVIKSVILMCMET